MQQGVNVLALVKDDERYIFLYDDESPQALLQQIGRFAADPELTAKAARLRSIPGVERADNLIVVFMNVVLPTGGAESVTVYALDDFRRWRLPWA